MKKKDSLTDFLIEHADSDAVSFHMPGHKGNAFFVRNGYENFIENFANLDITEIDGADNLYVMDGVIGETSERYKTMYGTIASYPLVNGSSCGIVAAILTLCNASENTNNEFIVARNSHKSVFNALRLAGATPAYLYPEIIEEYGISGAISPAELERVLQENPNACGIILPSPNYYGITSDVSGLADVAHKYGKTLIVDQAHGAHLKFFDKFGKNRKGQDFAAENLGADIVIDSTHKTLASFTQSALANICTERVSKELFERTLYMLESTSPSYLLMASLSINAYILEENGERLIREWLENLDDFYQRAKQINGLGFLENERHDFSKIVLNMKEIGLSGKDLYNELIDNNIYPELSDGSIVMCLSGIGNTKKDYDKLIEALKKIAEKHKDGKMLDKAPAKATIANRRCEADSKSGIAVKITAADFAKTRLLSLSNSIGKISFDQIVPYPPGVPLICPGEVVSEELVNYIDGLLNEGYSITGVNVDRKIRVL